MERSASGFLNCLPRSAGLPFFCSHWFSFQVRAPAGGFVATSGTGNAASKMFLLAAVALGVLATVLAFWLIN